MWKSVGRAPSLCEFYRGICLTTEEKTRKNLSQGSRRMPSGKEYTEQSIIVNKNTRNVKSRFKTFSDYETNTKSAGLNHCAFHAPVNPRPKVRGRGLEGVIMACRAKPRSAHLRERKKFRLRERKRLSPPINAAVTMQRLNIYRVWTSEVYTALEVAGASTGFSTAAERITDTR
jgi:hypothetical protein